MNFKSDLYLLQSEFEFCLLRCFRMRILLVLSALCFRDILTQNEGEGFKFNRVPDEPKMQSPNCDYCKISHHNTFCLHR